jgi:Fungal specific transcription factor domain
MLDITDCRDLTTLQAIVFMILFLQSTAKLATCYSHIGIALRACCRLGLHRNIKNNFHPVEQEERKRIFWLIRKLDAYVGALVGLPIMLSEEDVDQQLPIEVDDEFITTEGILPMPPGSFSLMSASNAHHRLVSILQKVVKFIYPIKGIECTNPGEPYSISHSRIREIEKDLQKWMDDLPIELRPSEDAPSELAR